MKHHIHALTHNYHCLHTIFVSNQQTKGGIRVKFQSDLFSKTHSCIKFTENLGKENYYNLDNTNEMIP